MSVHRYPVTLRMEGKLVVAWERVDPQKHVVLGYVDDRGKDIDVPPGTPCSYINRRPLDEETGEPVLTDEEKAQLEEIKKAEAEAAAAAAAAAGGDAGA